MAKVSLAVSIYNVAQYIERCARSLFEQTLEEMEYVFVDDGSTDDSVDILLRVLEEYPNRKEQMKLLRHDHNMGAAISKRDSMLAATGEYVLVVDSDDYIDSDMVEKLVGVAFRENADIAGCGYVEEYADHCVEHPQKYTNDHDEMMRAITLLTIKGVMWKLLVRSTIVTEHRDEVRFIPDRNMVDDYLFCCQIFYYAKRFCGVDRCMYHWIQYNPNNYTHTTIFAVESQAAAIRKTEEFYREKGVYDVVKDELLQRKFVSKLPLLLEKHCFDVKRWRALFPESNDCWRKMSFSRGNRLKFMIAQSPLYFLLIK